MRFSVIIPTFNRPQDLTRCLLALSCLDYCKDEFEVVVVDDGGGANLEPVVEVHRPHMQLRLLRQPNCGPAAARNNGAAHATGSVLAFVDDDCEPQGGWLRALDVCLARFPAALIGGRVVNGLPRNPNDAASQAIIDFLGEHFNRDPARGRFFPSNNIAIPTELFRQIGGFDANFLRSASEDRDFCDRWLARGWRLVAAPDAVVVHSRNMSFQGFWKQHRLYGRGAFSYAMARRRRSNGPVPFEGWRFHAGMILAPLRKSPRPRSIYLSFLILVSQVAVVVGYACEGRAWKQQRVPSGYNLARK
jgi:GT2 family glycosyltransferase